MERHGHLWSDRLRQTAGGDRIHRVVAADRQERDVGRDALELRQVVRVAGVVVHHATEVEQVPDPAVRLGVELEGLRARVVRGHGLELHAGDLVRLARRDRSHIARELPRDVVRGHELRAVLGQPRDLVGLEMVVVSVGEDHDVQTMKTTGPKIRRNHVLAEIEFSSKRTNRTSAINQHGPALG